MAKIPKVTLRTALSSDYSPSNWGTCCEIRRQCSLLSVGMADLGSLMLTTLTMAWIIYKLLR